MKRRTNASKWCLLAGFLLSAPLTRAQTFYSDEGHAEFTSRVPLHTFTGESENLVGRINLADSTVDFYIDLTTLETGIGKRDKDMRTTLETDDYPFAEFFGLLSTPFNPNVAVSQDVEVTGKFKIHGVSREVTIPGSLQLGSDGLRVIADWKLNLKDYDIVPPSLLIVKVDEVQEIHIDATLKPTQ